ncbi:MAG: hypothetical protein M3327_01920 [Actinomycetota bacterium]|nr:hypothetical protein [Actinomycetota bacterium]
MAFENWGREEMKKSLLALVAAPTFALAVASPASALCPAAEAGQPGRSEFAQGHITVLAHAGLLGHVHKPGEHRGASDCAALNP